IDIRAAWWSEWAQPSASNSSTSRYDKEKRRYQPTARRMTSGSNCLHLNRPETDDARSIGPAYQTTPAKSQHCLSDHASKVATLPGPGYRMSGNVVKTPKMPDSTKLSEVTLET